MLLIDLINQFLVKVQMRWSNGTYENYKSHLMHFVNWCSSNDITRTKQISAKVISDYISDMKQSCGSRTINMRIGNLQRCYDQMDVKFEFLQSIPMMKERIVTYDFIDLPELREIRKYLYNLPKTDMNIYQMSVILVLMETGCRRSELMMIEKKNVDLQKCSIRFVTTKTKVDREVPFKEKTVPILKRLLEMGNSKFLFHNPNTNKPMNKDGLENIFRKFKAIFAELIHLDKFHPHMLRHSFITHLIEAGTDRKIVQAMTGHADGKSLDRYIHVRRNAILQAYHDNLKLDD